MELVYIWIEEFKNIKKQGFNFSPNHEFELIKNEDVKYILEDKMKGKKNPVPDNFFGKDINNITAIIGKNGSGKSSLIEAITRFSRLETIRELESIFLLFKKNKDGLKDDFYYYKDFEQHTKFKNEYLKELYIEDLKIEKIEKLETQLDIIYYDNIILRNPFKENERYGVKDISSLYKYETEEKKSYGAPTVENLRIFISSETRRNIIFLRYFNKDKLESFKNQIELDLKLPNICYLKIENDKIKNVEDFNEKLIEKIAFTIIEKNNENINRIRRDKNSEPIKTKHPDKVTYLDVNKKGEYFSLFQKLIKLLLDYQTTDIYNFEDYVSLKSFKKIWEQLDSNTLLFKKLAVEFPDKELELKKYFNYVKCFYKFFYKNKTEIKLDDKGRIKVKLNGNKIDDLINFLNDKGKFPLPEEILEYEFDIEMSSGERAFLGLFSRFYSIIEETTKDNVLILMDEPEMFMHPEWQRKFINIFLKFSENIFPGKKIQIITTSHSPFMASDLPKENIIMLETYTKDDGYQKIGNCKIKENKDLKTFGANIHELYKESFFMDSTMGEFALSKIKGVIEDLTTLECIQRANKKLKKLEEKGEKLTETNKQEKDKLEESTGERVRKKSEIEEKKETIKYVIDQIGERVLSRKLGEKYRKIFGEKEKIEDKMKNLYSNLSVQEREILKNLGGQ